MKIVVIVRFLLLQLDATLSNCFLLKSYLEKIQHMFFLLSPFSEQVIFAFWPALSSSPFFISYTEGLGW